MPGKVRPAVRWALAASAWLLAAGPGAAQEAALVHVATAADTVDYVTYLDHPLLNGRPEAVFFVTPVYRGVYDPHPVAAYYYAAYSSWILENQDLADIPLGSAFHVWIPTPTALAPSQPAYVHTISPANLFGGDVYTRLDHWWINGNPGAKVHATVVRGPSYVPWEVILEYDAGTGRWIASTGSVANHWTSGTELHVCADDFCIGAGLLSASLAWTTAAGNTFGAASYTFAGTAGQTVLHSDLIAPDLSDLLDQPHAVWWTGSDSYRWALITQDGSAMPLNVPLRAWFSGVIFRNRFETGGFFGWTLP